MTFHKSIALGVPFKVIDRFHKSEPCFFRESRTCARCELGMRIDSSTHRCPPDRQFQHCQQSLFRSTNTQFKLSRKSTKFLTQSKWCCIRQMSSADLNDRIPLLRLFGQHLTKSLQCRY